MQVFGQYRDMRVDVTRKRGQPLPQDPPEDCGGPGGFADLKELLAGPPSPEREEMRAWAGEDYDPVHFDLAAASAAAAASV